MKQDTPTLIGFVDSVKGGVVTIRLIDDVPTFLMVDGRSYRVGQVGAFLRIPLGYTQLYAVCTLVGAAAAPKSDESNIPPGHRWLSATLFGESIGGVFERGVSQYDEDAQELHVQFVSGGYYIYHQVPSQIYEDLMSAPSKGSFLNREVKGVYQFAKQ